MNKPVAAVKTKKKAKRVVTDGVVHVQASFNNTVVTITDADGAVLDGSQRRYRLRFPQGGLPPVKAFWSLTLYSAETHQLVANPIDRYLVNSAMPLRRDPDGGLSILIQSEDPGEGGRANWLPAPAGPFLMALRLYWPGPEILNKSWREPRVERVA